MLGITHHIGSRLNLVVHSTAVNETAWNYAIKQVVGLKTNKKFTKKNNFELKTHPV